MVRFNRLTIEGMPMYARGSPWAAYAAAIWASVLGQHVSRPLVFGLAVTGSVLLGLRSIASLVQIGYLAATGRLAGLGIWEPWFYLGAVLFGLSTWKSRRVRHR